MPAIFIGISAGITDTLVKTLFSFRVNGYKLDENERCLAEKDHFNYVSVQSQKPVGDVQAIEMRVTANKEVSIELGEIVLRSVLCRDPMVGYL